MFKNFFELEPQALELFSFRNSQDIYDNKVLKAHGKAVMSQIDKCVKNLKSSLTEIQ
jgi:hydroxyacyl-ACP dehydratase HTD2-like protein with hotdog domain